MKSKKKIILPKLNKFNYSKKKYKYKLSYNSKKRRLSLDEDIKIKSKKKGVIKAAIAKKGRLNILRIYRRYKNPKQCIILTNDMKYIDKKYKLGNTKNICKKTKRKRNH